jgi:hypothetical protein
MSTIAQYVTPNSKIYFEKVKTCWLRSENGFFGTKVVHLAVAGTLHLSANCMYVQTPLCTSKKECNKLDLTATQYF